MLLSLIFADAAFDGLSNPEELFQLRVPQGLNQLPLPFREEWCSVPVFRRLSTSVYGVRIAPNLAATDNWLRDKLKALGNATGFEVPVGPYCFRRGAGEALDSSSMHG